MILLLLRGIRVPCRCNCSIRRRRRGGCGRWGQWTGIRGIPLRRQMQWRGSRNNGGITLGKRRSARHIPWSSSSSAIISHIELLLRWWGRRGVRVVRASSGDHASAVCGRIGSWKRLHPCSTTRMKSPARHHTLIPHIRRHHSSPSHSHVRRMSLLHAPHWRHPRLRPNSRTPMRRSRTSMKHLPRRQRSRCRRRELDYRFRPGKFQTWRRNRFLSIPTISRHHQENRLDSIGRGSRSSSIRGGSSIGSGI